MYFLSLLFFFCKQKTAYEMRISDWSSDVCSSDLFLETPDFGCVGGDEFHLPPLRVGIALVHAEQVAREQGGFVAAGACADFQHGRAGVGGIPGQQLQREGAFGVGRSEEHTSELQSLMRISYAVFCLKKKKYDYSPIYTQLHHTITNDRTSTLPST